MVRRQLIVILTLFVLFFTTQLWAQLVQMSDEMDWNPNVMSYSATFASGQYQNITLPNNTTSGNLLTVFQELDDTATPPTVTLQSNDTSASTTIQTFTLLNPSDASCKANGRDILMYYLPNVTGGHNTIRVAYHSTNGSGGGAAAAEWANVAQNSPVDGYVCSGSQGSGTSLTFNAGSFTPAQSGELVIEHAWNAYLNIAGGAGVGTFYTAGTGQGNISWTKLLDGALWANGAQWGVYNSTSALNPSFTINTTSGNTAGALRIAAFFKPQSGAGGNLSGIHVIAKKNFSNTSSTNGTSQFSFTSITFPFPCTGGNLLAADWAAGPADLTSVSDTLGNTWISNHAVGDPNTVVHTYSARNATTRQDQKVTLHFNSASLDTAYLYCIAGAATSPFDKATVAGTNVNGGSSLSIAPSTSNGLVLVTGSQGTATTQAFSSPSGALYHGCFVSNENSDGGGCAANNTWGLFNNSTTAAETWTVSTWNGEGLSIWAAEADAYEASAGGSSPSAPTNLTATVK